MPRDLMDMFLNSTGELNKTAEETLSGFAAKLSSYKQKATDDFCKYNIPLNTTIAKLAKDNSLNRNQVQRIVEEANNQTYLTKYEQMKGNLERDVRFPLADTDEIVKMAGISEESKEKTASTNETLNAFNYTAYEFGSTAEDSPRTLQSVLAEKIASEITDCQNTFEEYDKKIVSGINKVAEYLVEVDKKGNAQSAFNTMCRDLFVRHSVQDIIIKQAQNVLENQKIQKTAATDRKLNLDFCDITTPEEMFSLGNYSLAKTASDDTIVLSDGTPVRGTLGLIKIAKDMLADFSTAKKAQERKDQLMSKIHK